MVHHVKLPEGQRFEFTPLRPNFFIVTEKEVQECEWVLNFDNGIRLRRVLTSEPRWLVDDGLITPDRGYTLTTRIRTAEGWSDPVVTEFRSIYMVRPHIEGIDPRKETLVGQEIWLGYDNLKELGITVHGLQWRIFKGSESVYENIEDERIILDTLYVQWGHDYLASARVFNNTLGWSEWASIPFKVPDTRPDTPVLLNPDNGSELETLYPLLKASPYQHPFDVGFRRREFAVERQGFNNSLLVSEKEFIQLSENLPFNSYWRWRCRDVDVTGQPSNWTMWSSFHILPMPSTPSIDVRDYYSEQDHVDVVLEGPEIPPLFDLKFVRREIELYLHTTLVRVVTTTTPTLVLDEPLEHGRTYYWRFRDIYDNNFHRGWSDKIELNIKQVPVEVEPISYWDKKLLFWLESGSSHYPELNKKYGIINELQILRYPGNLDRSLIAYKVATAVTRDQWTQVNSKRKTDGIWFSFGEDGDILDYQRLLKLAHRHFIKEVLSDTQEHNIDGALIALKSSSGLGTDIKLDDYIVRYWDIFHRTVVTNNPLDTDMSVQQELCFKATQISKTNMRPIAIEPYKSGLYFVLPLNHSKATDYHQLVQKVLKSIDWADGFPVSELELKPFHLRYPN